MKYFFNIAIASQYGRDVTDVVEMKENFDMFVYIMFLSCRVLVRWIQIYRCTKTITKYMSFYCSCRLEEKEEEIKYLTVLKQNPIHNRSLKLKTIRTFGN